MEALTEVAGDLVRRAEAAGFRLRQAEGLAIATLPAALSSVDAEPIIEELANCAVEVGRELRARDERERDRRVAGRPAAGVSLLQVGVTQRFEGDMLVLRCEMPKGGRADLTFPRAEVMFIADADERHAAQVDAAGASGPAQRDFLHQIQARGVRFWTHEGCPVFGWPGMAGSASTAIAILHEAMLEAANWASTKVRSKMSLDVLASDALSDAFLKHVKSDQAIVYEFGRRSRRDRETAACLLLSMGCLAELRKLLSCDAATEPEEDLSGARALMPDANLVVTIERRDGDLVLCRDRTGRALRFAANRLLAIETDRAPRRPKEKTGLLDALRW